MKPSKIIVFSIFAVATAAALVQTPLATGQAAKRSPQSKKSAYVKTVRESLRESPRGSEIGVIRAPAQVSVLEQGRVWSKIRVEGWVRNSALAEKRPKFGFNQKVKALEVLGVDIKRRKRRKKGQSDRVLLTIKVKNLMDMAIGSWRGTLFVQTASGKEVVRELVSYNDSVMKPGDTRSLSFFWEQGEKPYELLMSTPKNQLIVQLANLKVSR